MADDFFAAAGAHTLQSLIDLRARETPDAVFFISPETGRVVSYAELARRVRAVGEMVREIPTGAPLGLMAGNGWAAAQTLLGAPYHGRMALIFNLASGDSQLEYMMRHSGCALVAADEQNMQRAREIAGRCGGVRVVSVDRDAGFCGEECAPPPVDANSPALLIYTSGTTGKPKGVLHGHRSLLFGGANTAAAHNLSPADRALCVLPLYHINGQCVTVFAPLISGGSVVIPHRFSAGNFWREIQDNECTWFSAVPTIFSHLLNGEAPPSLPKKLRFGRSASSALPPEVLRRFEQKFSAPVVETMGLTETAAQILSNPPPPQRGKIGSPGVAVGCEVRIVRGGKEVPRGEEGEIAVRGENVMLGYLHEKPVLEDGWLMTGDLGRMDADGYVFVTGRTKELIIKGGENIAPREIDDALYAVPGVAEAAAFGVPCKIYGQQVEAAVAGSFSGGEEKLRAVCEKAVGKFKSPRRIHFLPSLPKGPSGKIQRLKLAELCGAQAEE